MQTDGIPLVEFPRSGEAPVLAVLQTAAVEKTQPLAGPVIVRRHEFRLACDVDPECRRRVGWDHHARGVQSDNAVGAWCIIEPQGDARFAARRWHIRREHWCALVRGDVM